MLYVKKVETQNFASLLSVRLEGVRTLASLVRGDQIRLNECTKCMSSRANEVSVSPS